MTKEQGLTDCETFERRLNDLVDNRLGLADDPSLIRHAQACSECSSLLNDYRQLLSVQPRPSKLARRRIPRIPLRRRSKLKWAISLAPSIFALMIVAVSMLKGAAIPEGFAGRNAVWGGPRMQNVVDQTLVAERHSGVSAYRYDPFDESVWIKNGVFNSVQGCSDAFYQLAQAQSRLRACDWKFDVVSKVASPHEPIHSQVPYRGEFSGIPKYRFLLGITLRLIEMTFSGQLDLSKPDLGFHSEDFWKASVA